MKKLRFPTGFVLTGTDNNGFRHRYSVIKNEHFKKIFAEFMEELGFDKGIIARTFEGYDEVRGYFELRIYEFEDCCWHYENKQYDVDVFYGNKKIIIVVRTKTRRPLLDNLEMKSRWIKVPKIKKIKEPRNKIPLQTPNINLK